MKHKESYSKTTLENSLIGIWKASLLTLKKLWENNDDVGGVLGLIEKVGWYLDDGSDGAANGAFSCNFADIVHQKR